MANMTGLVVARHVRLPGVRREGMQHRTQRAVAYVSTEGHTCLRKALELLGFGSDNIRLIAVDDRLRLRVADLETAIQNDVRNGCVPVVVAASAGTASTGAIDPLGEIRDVCRRHGVWFHVDAAYGGPAILSGRYGQELAALRDADSLALDPHKWLSVPVKRGCRSSGCGRDARRLQPGAALHRTGERRASLDCVVQRILRPANAASGRLQSLDGPEILRHTTARRVH
jgi:glutamate/tyrosine decarboxylase-like PLP-dependent enzyme